MVCQAASTEVGDGAPGLSGACWVQPKPRGLAKPLPCCVQVGKLITKTEIPAFIPRADLMDQLVRCGDGRGLWVVGCDARWTCALSLSLLC